MFKIPSITPKYILLGCVVIFAALFYLTVGQMTKECKCKEAFDDVLNTNYEANNYDVQYHDDIGDLTKQDNIYYTSMQNIKVLDASGNLVILPYAKSQNSPVYYEFGEYKYGAKTYVPDYVDGVYLSILSAGLP